MLSDRGYVLYGKTGDELFAQHLTSGAWQMLDCPSLDVIKAFPGFEEMLDHAVQATCDA